MYSRAKIKIHNLSKSFGDKKVLNGIDLEVRAGESLVVIGGSGSGKSVLLKSMLGLLMPDQGSCVLIDGEDLTFMDIAKRRKFIAKFGMLFQGGALFDGLPIWHNVSFSLLISGKITRLEARNLAIAKLKMVDLGSEVADLYPAEISGGMQKRVALARAIAANPEIMFFDEPTAGLDPVTANTISNLIKNVAQKLSATTITITHDMHCMHTVADKVALLYGGKVEWSGDLIQMETAHNNHLTNFITAGQHASSHEKAPLSTQ